MIPLRADIAHKIEWCESLLQRIDALNQIYIDNEPARAEPFRADFEEPGRTLPGREFWQLKVKVQVQPPREISFLAGDFFQNLRSCLDYLANALVVSSGGVPKTGGFGTSFPILEVRKDTRLKMSGCTNKSILGIINDLQPYQDEFPRQHPLFRINEFANEYKHRELRIFAGLAGYPANFALVDRTAPVIEGAALANMRFVHDDDRLDPLMFPFRQGVTPEAVADFETVVTLDSTERPIYSITDELDFYLRYVRDYVVPRFRNFFDAEWPEEVFSQQPIFSLRSAGGVTSSEKIIESFKHFFEKLTQGVEEPHIVILGPVTGLNTEPS